MAAALTLVPAVARLMGAPLFWPRPIPASGQENSGRVWGRLARGVVRHPFLILIGLIVLGFDAWMRSRGGP